MALETTSVLSRSTLFLVEPDSFPAQVIKLLNFNHELLCILKYNVQPMTFLSSHFCDHPATMHGDTKKTTQIALVYVEQCLTSHSTHNRSFQGQKNNTEDWRLLLHQCMESAVNCNETCTLNCFFQMTSERFLYTMLHMIINHKR